MAKEKTIRKTVKKAMPKLKVKKAREDFKVQTEKMPEVKVSPAAQKAEVTVPLASISSYFYGVGRRKSAIAQVRVYLKGKGDIKVNNKDLKNYFPEFEFQNTVIAPLKLSGQEARVDVSAKVRGGGKRGQADSIRHGISRALLKLDENLRKSLKKAGFLTRDARVKERKKPGLKRARRAPQWSKR